MIKTGDAKPINVISDTVQDKGIASDIKDNPNEGVYVRDFVHPWSDERALESICEAMSVPIEVAKKNVKVIIKVLP